MKKDINYILFFHFFFTTHAHAARAQNAPLQTPTPSRLRTHAHASHEATRVAESLTLGEEMFVKTFAGTTVTLAFNPAETVGEVRAKMASQEGVRGAVEASDLRLVFAGETLDDDDCILADYGVQRDSTLFLARTMRISVKDPFVTVPVGGDEEDKEARLFGEEVFTLDILSSNTVGDVLNMIAAERGIDRRRVKLTDGKPGMPIRGFYRVFPEGGTLADWGLDESTEFVLEQLLPIEVPVIGESVDLWTYEDLDAIFCKLVQNCPEKLAGKFNTASAFLSGCRQTKMEVLRSLTYRN